MRKLLYSPFLSINLRPTSRSQTKAVLVKLKLAAALARVMSVAVPIPALASVSVLQSAAVGGSIVGVVGPL